MAKRMISEEMVRHTVEQPEQTGTGYLGRRLAFRSYAEGTLKVVYQAEPDCVIIITTIWE